MGKNKTYSAQVFENIEHELSTLRQAMMLEVNDSTLFMVGATGLTGKQIQMTTAILGNADSLVDILVRAMEENRDVRRLILNTFKTYIEQSTDVRAHVIKVPANADIEKIMNELLNQTKKNGKQG